MTRRRRRPLVDKVWIVVDWRTGQRYMPGRTTSDYRFIEPSTADLLASLPEAVERVLLAGPRMFDTLDELRGWAMDILPPGWAPGQHWLPSVDAPILRYVRPDGRRVELIPAGTWFGPLTAGAAPRDIGTAWSLTRITVSERFGVGYLLPSPATTGRECLLATLPRYHEWPVLADDLADLIRSTSGQGRQELLAPVADLAELVELDARFAYGALARNVPVGNPRLHPGPPRDPMAFARVHAEWTVPEHWAGRPGLLPEQGDRRTWHWDATPGHHGRGWIDGAELWLAQRNGWNIHATQTLEWPTGGTQPLRTWANKLQAARAELDGSRLGLMVRWALRAMLITSIGAFVGRPYTTTRWAPRNHPELVPTGARNIRHQAGAIVYDLPETNRWRDTLTHPEWSASIWGRTRVRMLHSPTGTADRHAGLLHLPPNVTAHAVALDALYLSNDPQWPDDGHDGRLRLKHTWPGPHTIPAGRTAFYRYIRNLPT